MKSLQKLLKLVLIGLVPMMTIGQELKTNLFLRTPQVVNYNLTNNEIGYNPIISIGAGLSHKSKFIELATFLSADDVYGFYTFFGTTLKKKPLGEHWNFFANWFGEITYLPEQTIGSDSFTYTSGLCFFLNYSFDWGSLGFPLCVGMAYNQRTISLNTRAILNISIPLN